MSRSPQKQGMFAAIGTIVQSVFQAGLSSLIPGQIGMDAVSKRMVLGRPDGSGATVILMTPLDPVENNADGEFMRRVGGVNYATDATLLGVHRVRVLVQAFSPFGVSLADSTPVEISVGPDVTTVTASVGNANYTSLGDGTGCGVIAKVIPDATVGPTSGRVDVIFGCAAAGIKPVTITVGPTTMTVLLTIT